MIARRSLVMCAAIMPTELRPVQSSGDVLQMMLCGSSSHTVQTSGLTVTPTLSTLSQPGSPHSHYCW